MGSMAKLLVSVVGLVCAIIGVPALATEEAPYSVALQEGAFEVRNYPALVIAQVNVSGDRDEAASTGFRLLAGYIFGGNQANQSIAMTAPVTQAPKKGEAIAMTAPVTQTGTPDGWNVRFFMPRGYTIDTLPLPNDPQVHLAVVPPSRAAVVRFSGLASERDVEQKTAELNAFIISHQLRSAGPPTLARFNPPWTLWFMRRNEVLIPLDVEAPN